MKKVIKHIAFRLILLLIPYLAFYFMFAESGFKGQTYDIDEIPLYLFFAVWVYIFLETFFWLYKKNRAKWTGNIAVLLLMVALYFILPHRNYFN